MQLSIVSYLDETATSKVRVLQEAVSKITGSRVCLDSWQPHITIGDGVDLGTENQYLAFAKEIEAFATKNHPIEISSHLFGYRDSRPIGTGELSTPYVLELKVNPNKILEDLVSRLSQITNKYPKWYTMSAPYQPHITIAFRDLDEKGYRLGIEYLEKQKIDIKSLINHISLVERLPDQDNERTRLALNLQTDKTK